MIKIKLTITLHGQRMKLQFWSIGKNNEPYVKLGVEDFTKRISNYFKVEWNIIPVPKNAGMMSEAGSEEKRRGNDPAMVA